MSELSDYKIRSKINGKQFNSTVKNCYTDLQAKFKFGEAVKKKYGNDAKIEIIVCFDKSNPLESIYNMMDDLGI